MTRSLALGLVVLHASAWAQAPDPKPPSYRLSLVGGFAYRTSTLALQGHSGAKIEGFAPFTLHLSGSYFFLSWLGVQLDGFFETYKAELKIDSRVNDRLFGGLGSLELVGRWSPLYLLGLELHLGYGVGGWPVLEVTGTSLKAQSYVYHGPVVGLAVAIEPDAPVGGQLFFRLMPGLGGGLSPSTLSFGFQLHFLNLALGTSSRGSIVLESEFVQAGAKTGELNHLDATELRFNIGLRLRHQPPRPEGGDVLTPKTGNGRVRGRAVVGGIGIAGVTVTAGALPPVKTGPDGDFAIDDVKPGPLIVRALAEGYKPLEQMVDVPPGDEAVVTLALVKPTGPGKIRGVVKGDKDAPVADAEVALEGRAAVKTASDGSYQLEQAGPGPVKVTVKAKGYKDAEDAAQVPPEGVATLDVTLVKQGEKQLATIRGLVVRASTGKPVKATVKISDVNQTVPVKADGRFVVQVPGGKYTLTIEAAGYVSQVKTVEVADGDQAIFHCDLQPAGR